MERYFGTPSRFWQKTRQFLKNPQLPPRPPQKQTYISPAAPMRSRAHTHPPRLSSPPPPVQSRHNRGMSGSSPRARSMGSHAQAAAYRSINFGPSRTQRKTGTHLLLPVTLRAEDPHPCPTGLGAHRSAAPKHRDRSALALTLSGRGGMRAQPQASHRPTRTQGCTG